MASISIHVRQIEKNKIQYCKNIDVVNLRRVSTILGNIQVTHNLTGHSIRKLKFSWVKKQQQ